MAYMDLVEKPIKEWISGFCNMACDKFGIGDNPLFMDKYCLIFPEIVGGKKKCILVYVDLDYPPFDEIIRFEVDVPTSKYLETIIVAITSILFLYAKPDLGAILPYVPFGTVIDIFIIILFI